MKVSGIAEKEFKENFSRQGYRNDSGGVTKWIKRKHNKNQRDASRAILIKSGRLRRGFKKRPDANTARVINDVTYAKVHSAGGAIYHPEGVRKLMFRRFRNGKVRFARERVASFGQRTRTPGFYINIPPRPFMITTKPLLNDISKTAENDVREIYNSVR